MHSTLLDSHAKDHPGISTLLRPGAPSPAAPIDRPIAAPSCRPCEAPLARRRGGKRADPPRRGPGSHVRSHCSLTLAATCRRDASARAGPPEKRCSSPAHPAPTGRPCPSGERRAPGPREPRSFTLLAHARCYLPAGRERQGRYPLPRGSASHQVDDGAEIGIEEALVGAAGDAVGHPREHVADDAGAIGLVFLRKDERLFLVG